MKLLYKKYIGLFCLAIVSISCSKEVTPIVVQPDHFHTAIDKVTEVLIHDIFSPPVASRIYAYPNIAAYEIMASQSANYNSLAGQLKELTPIPKVEEGKDINYELAALVAHMDLSRRLVFSEDKLNVYRDSLYNVWGTANPQQLADSKSYGLQVAEHIAQWYDADNYKQTRTMPKFSVNTDCHFGNTEVDSDIYSF